MQAHQEKIIKTLARIIKYHRLKQGKSIHQISAEFGIQKPTWYRVEAAKYKNIELTTIWRISEALEIPVEDLISELHKELGSDFSLSDDD